MFTLAASQLLQFPKPVVALDRVANEHIPSWTAHRLPSSSFEYELSRREHGTQSLPTS
jgi:hypothetical protein